MTDADRFASKTRELRHCIHDLVAFSTLPAAWLEYHSTTDTGGHRGDDALDARFGVCLHRRPGAIRGAGHRSFARQSPLRWRFEPSDSDRGDRMAGEAITR